MGQTPESKVKKEVVKILQGLGAYYFFPATGGYGKSGVPDIIVCFNGHFVGIECKAGKKSPTALQIRELSSINRAGGVSLVAREDNLTYISGRLKLLKD